MLEVGKRYTAAEVLELAGFAPSVIGETLVTVGGLNVSSADYEFRVAELGKLTVVVGTETVELDVVEAKEEEETE